MDAPYVEHRRDLRGLTAEVERRALARLAALTPAAVNPDHLTALGLFAMALCGLAYALAGRYPAWLLAVNVGLALNWLGDSLDGTLARYRKRPRPRYGFYVDHMVDAFGALFLLGGLAVSGLMAPALAIALLLGVYLMFLNMALATYSRGIFKMSQGPFGGTELRIILALLNVAAWVWPTVTALGVTLRLFDVVGMIGAIGLFLAVLKSTAENTVALYRLERV